MRFISQLCRRQRHAVGDDRIPHVGVCNTASYRVAGQYVSCCEDDPYRVAGQYVSRCHDDPYRVAL
jgi:hypothetical protein